jgi:hypothetical protein
VSSIESALKFYVAERSGAPLILVPSLGGIPEVAVPSYPLLRVSYLSPEDATVQRVLGRAKTDLRGDHPLLFLMTPSPDGPPNRSGVSCSPRLTCKCARDRGFPGLDNLDGGRPRRDCSASRHPLGEQYTLTSCANGPRRPR